MATTSRSLLAIGALAICGCDAAEDQPLPECDISGTGSTSVDRRDLNGEDPIGIYEVSSVDDTNLVLRQSDIEIDISFPPLLGMALPALGQQVTWLAPQTEYSHLSIRDATNGALLLAAGRVTIPLPDVPTRFIDGDGAPFCRRGDSLHYVAAALEIETDRGPVLLESAQEAIVELEGRPYLARVPIAVRIDEVEGAIQSYQVADLYLAPPK